MSIKAAFMVPHPPMIVHEVGCGSEQQVIKTIESYEKVADEVASINPDTIIISSPHAPYYSDYFYISKGPIRKGNFKSFGAEEVSFEEEIDEKLVDTIESICKDEEFPAGRIIDKDLDHGTMVPLYFIRKKYPKCKIIVIGLSTLPLIDNYKMGTIIKRAVDKLNRKVVYIASGDLSHKLQTYGPYGFIEEGPIYDKRIMDVCSNARFNELLEFDEVFLDKAAECGHRSFTIMAGTLDGLNVISKQYSHEDVTGVGYGICSFYPSNENNNRKYLDLYLNNEKRKISSKDELVNLAKKAIESYILNEEIISIPNEISKEYLDNKAGVFVSIHKFGSLRGCIGTFLPTTNSIAQEVINNAINSSTKDPRFEPIKKNELKYLEINVDVLSTPEDIDSKDMLDVKKYGVIVSSGYKRGLLLPDLDGIDTIDKQISIAMQKGNINNTEEIKLQRFEVIRHK